MMKKIIGILIVCLYCFPFVYYSMYLDFIDSSMRGYAIMIAATFLLAFSGRLFSHPAFLIAGNILSALISYYFIGTMDDSDHWGGYFKPLYPEHLLILVSFIILIPQVIAFSLAGKFRKRLGHTS